MSGTRAQSILDRLFGFALRRDGQAQLLQRQALGTEEASPEVPEPPAAGEFARRHPGVMAPRRVLHDALASKTLNAWLQNRQQTLFPLTLNLTILDADARGLVVRMVAAAALAGGEAPGAAERERIRQELAAAGAEAAEMAQFDAALADPAPMPPLLQAVQEARLGPHAYAASLLALDRRNEVGRAWLDYLAVRLALPAEVVLGLQRRRRWRR